jgi:hypothetical protein
MRRASRSDWRIHCRTRTASIVTLTTSPPAHRMPPAARWSANGSDQVSCSAGYQSPPSRVLLCMIVRPRTVWNGTDSTISRARAGYGHRCGSGSSPSSGQKNRQPVMMKCAWVSSWTSEFSSVTR